MDIDWVAVYGAVLSTALAAAGLLRWIREKPKEREQKVRGLFEGLLSPARIAVENLDADGTDALIPLFRHMFANRTQIVGLSPVLEKSAPETAKILDQLIGLIDGADRDNPVSTAIILSKKKETKQLVVSLHNEVEKWLSYYA